MRTETGGEFYDSPFFVYRGDCLTKPFLNYQQQIGKLVNEKQLIINNVSFAEEKLRELGYFTLIGGYKDVFRDSNCRFFKYGTCFEDIYATYAFDNSLRELIFRYICCVEKKLRSLISYSFCEQYGELQAEYLNISNYNVTNRNRRDINKLIQILDRLANCNTDSEYLIYQRNKYGNVPLWVLVNALTFGQLSKMYLFLQPRIKSRVSYNFACVNERELSQYLKVLVLYRNVCAHNERLFSYRVYSEIPDTIIHKKLRIDKIGNQYRVGKKDLFSVVIALRYLLPREDFLVFKKLLGSLLRKYLRECNLIVESELLEKIGFPNNWKNIARYKL